MMDDEEIRLECLKLARENGAVGAAVTDEAKKLFDFVKRRGEFSAFHGARFIEPKLENDKVRVVGKDGDLPDYIKE